MRTSRFRSYLALSCVGACIAPLFASCDGKTIAAPGSVMVSITTDMQARKDIDQIGLIVTSGGKVIFDDVQSIAPQIYFPTTTALVGSRDEARPVHIRVYAFHGSESRVLRQAITTVPKDRSVLLRLPVEWVNDGSAIGTLSPGQLLKDVIDPLEKDFVGALNPTLKPKCGAGETMIGGKCVSAEIDSSTLPEYKEEAVFGGGGAESGGACYDVTTCFSTATLIPLDTACEGPAFPGAPAYAIKNPEGGDDFLEPPGGIPRHRVQDQVLVPKGGVEA